MAIVQLPLVKVLTLIGFVARPGHAARPGEVVEVLPSVANMAIATGQARLLTADDDVSDDADGGGEITNLDPSPHNRDPRNRRR